MYTIYKSQIYRLTKRSNDIATSLLFTAARHFEVWTFQVEGWSDNSTGLLKGKNFTLSTES